MYCTLYNAVKPKNCQQKVPILKKTTGLCPAMTYYSMPAANLCMDSMLVVENSEGGRRAVKGDVNSLVKNILHKHSYQRLAVLQGYLTQTYISEVGRASRISYTNISIRGGHGGKDILQTYLQYQRWAGRHGYPIQTKGIYQRWAGRQGYNITKYFSKVGRGVKNILYKHIYERWTKASRISDKHTHSFKSTLFCVLNYTHT